MKLLVGPEQMLSGVMRACYVAKKMICLLF